MFVNTKLLQLIMFTNTCFAYLSAAKTAKTLNTTYSISNIKRRYFSSLTYRKLLDSYPAKTA